MAPRAASADSDSEADQVPGATVLDALEDLAFGLVALTSEAIAESTTRGELTVQQWRVLVVLGGADAGMRVAALARRIAASGPSTSRLVKRLTQRGLVEVTPDPGDGRALRIGLSGAGMELRARIVARRRELIRATVGPRTARRRQSRELAGFAEALRSVS